MNERIEKLVVQSKLIEIIDSSYLERDDWEPFVEKFAESIVQECIEKITTYDLVPGHSAKWEDIYEIHARLLQDLGEELKQHFGIE